MQQPTASKSTTAHGSIKLSLSLYFDLNYFSTCEKSRSHVQGNLCVWGNIVTLWGAHLPYGQQNVSPQSLSHYIRPKTWFKVNLHIDLG